MVLSHLTFVRVAHIACIINISKCCPWKSRLMSWDTTFAMASLMANIKICSCRPIRLALVLIVSKILMCKIVYLKTYDNFTEYNFRNDAIQWQISKSTNDVSCIYALVLTVSEMLTFQVFDHQKLSQSHRVQFSYWRHSMTSVKIYKRNFLHVWFSLRYDPC